MFRVYIHLKVSENAGTPKSSFFWMFHYKSTIINHFGDPPMMESPQKKAMNCSVENGGDSDPTSPFHRLDQAQELIFHGLRRDQFRDSDMINHKI